MPHRRRSRNHRHDSLSKDRERRYQSAGEFGRDLQHYLHDEPIEAKRDSAIYLLRRTLYRYRAAAASFLLFMLLLLVSSIALWILHNQANAQRDIAREALIQAAHDRDLAQTAADRYRRELQATDTLTLSSLGLSFADFNPRRTAEDAFFGDVVTLQRPELPDPSHDDSPDKIPSLDPSTAPAALRQYPLSSLAINYARPDPANPPLADLLNLPITFAVQDNALLTPRPGLPLLQLRIADIGQTGPHAITAAAIELLYIHIVHYFHSRGLEAVWVALDDQDVTVDGRDVRPPDRTPLQLLISLGHITEIKTILWDAEPLTPDERVNRPSFAEIVNRSPLKPLAAGGPDLLDTHALKAFVSHLSEDMGPVVAVVRMTQNPAELSLQYYFIYTSRGRSQVPSKTFAEAYRRIFIIPKLDDHGRPMHNDSGEPLWEYNDSTIRNALGFSWRAYNSQRGDNADIPGFPAWLAQQPPPEPHAPLALSTLRDMHIIIDELRGRALPGTDAQVLITTYISRIRPANIREADFVQLLDLPSPAPAAAP